MSYNYNNSRAEGYADEDEYVLHPVPLSYLYNSVCLSVEVVELCLSLQSSRKLIWALDNEAIRTWPTIK